MKGNAVGIHSRPIDNCKLYNSRLCYLCLPIIQFSSVQSFSRVWLLATPWTTARPPCPSPTPGVYSNSCPLTQWCHPTISSYVVPFSSSLQSFPASGSLQMSQLFTSGGQSIGVSESVSSNCLKLPFGTQSRSWKLESGYKKQGTEMNLLTDQKEIHRLRKWIYGCQGKR